jgi:CDGSH-type Zn-finger protein
MPAAGGDSSVGDDRGSVPPRRVRPLADGPVLIEGPVEVELPDGSTRYSDRFLVALCVCRRSRTYPFCDTSHRRKCRDRRSDAAAANDDQSSTRQR